ncbi:M15 family metallopeptidase [Pendulispora rubella]|uniref:D-alanyl-D-alanine dipeptidase n=1 Tax=Pendulispora rubella TaxID=2741070 RepID=A0ABZ2LA67_9BACT
MERTRRSFRLHLASIVLTGLAAAAFLPACGSDEESENAGPTDGAMDSQIQDASIFPSWAFVSIAEVDPTIIVEMRYITDHNFLGTPVRGYNAAKCLLTRPAATALAKVQTELRPLGLSLKVYDCYRPQGAVDHFVEWAKDLNDTKMRQEFYPTVDKANLFRDGYIAEKSGHTRGSTLDVTIVALPAGEQEVYKSGDALRECTLPADQRFKDNSLDFGTGFDCFDLLAHPENPALTGPQRATRMLLRSMMDKYGFKGLVEEWWHFTLRNEPFPKTYFKFTID